MAKKKTINIAQEMLNEIVPPIKTVEEEIEFRRRCEQEYERSKQEILEIMKKNIEKYKDE